MSAEFKKAIKYMVCISSICSLAPSFSADANNMSVVKEMMRTGKTQQALVQLDKLLSGNPDCAPGHYYRGKILASKGQTTQALEEFQAAVLLAENEREIKADSQKQINLLQAKFSSVSKAAAQKGRTASTTAVANKQKFFELSAEQSRHTAQVSDRLRSQLRAQVGDLYHLASTGSVLSGEIDDYPGDQPPPRVPIAISTGPGPVRSPGIYDVNPIKPPPAVPIIARTHRTLINRLPEHPAVEEVPEELEIPDVKLSAVEKQKLSNHDIVFIVDHSGSMQTRDCPGRMSRWQWIQAEVSQMGEETKQALPRGVNAVFFDQNAEEFKKASAQELLRLFKVFNPAGGTNTGLAFRTQSDNIRDSLAANHPVVVIAITDGCPNNGLDLTQAIEDLDTIASRQKAKLKIAFLQIGTNANGLQTLSSLHELLDGHKTKVNVHAFSEVNAKGLTRTILDEL